MQEPPRWMTPEEALDWTLLLFGAWFLFNLTVGLWWPIWPR